MSSTIEYRRAAFVKHPDPEASPLAEDQYYLFVESGSSNCYEVDTGRRSRSWEFVAAGEKWQVIAEVCRNAAYCEGGLLKVRGRWTKPENYIKLWRKTLAEARPVSELLSRLPIRYVRLYLESEEDREVLGSYDQEAWDKLNADGWKHREGYYDITYLVKCIEGPETLDEWNKYKRHPWVKGGSATVYS